MQHSSEFDLNTAIKDVERVVRAAVAVDVDALVNEGSLIPERGRWYRVRDREVLEHVWHRVTQFEVTEWDKPAKPSEYRVRLSSARAWKKLAAKLDV